jgi:hypothetical protein
MSIPVAFRTPMARPIQTLRSQYNTGTRFRGEEGQQTPESLRKVLEKLEYKPGFRFVAYGDTAQNLHVQVQYKAPDNNKPNSPADWRVGARKWPIPASYNEGQIYQTLLVALNAIEEHEIRETFLYKGQRIFNPHHDLDKLTKYLRVRMQVPKPMDEVLLTKGHFQKLFNDCTTMGFGLKLEKLTPAQDSRVTLVLRIVEKPGQPVPDAPLTDGYKDRLITFVTERNKTNVLRNLMESLINEQKQFTKWRFRNDGIAIHSNEVPIDYLLDYTRLNPPPME